MPKETKKPQSRSSDSNDSGGSEPSQKRDGKSGPTPPPPAKLSRGLMSWIMILALLIMLFVLLSGTKSRGIEIKTWSDFTSHIKNDHFVNKPLIILDNRITGIIKQGTKGFPQAKKEGAAVWVKIDAQNRDIFLNQLLLLGAKWEVDTGSSVWVQLLIAIAPFLLLILIIWFFIARSMRSAGAGPGGMLGSFGKSRHRISTKENINVDFDDVQGIEEAKDELVEIVEFLKNPKKFQRLGGRIPRGVLLIGPPGCGKTLLAKAIAGEADVPFFSISGSDFVEMFVGVGASRVRDLFKQAKDNSPCIIFLDEIDAVGRRRGGGFNTGGHDEREQTLNAILVEMDGFEANDQIIVISATNRADVLDPALTRPGRFDRQVVVPLPDIVGRKKILEVHARKVKLSPEMDLERIARGTPMFSGADLEAIINESAIIATMANKDFVELSDLEEARDKVRFGRAQKSRRIEKDDRIATAYHEAGHAVIQATIEHADPLHKVTIIPRGQALGATFSLPDKDRYGMGRKFLLATMRILCGGRIAEQRKTNDISSGAAMDIKQSTQFARHMILEWGMSEKLGFVNYGGSDTREMYMPEREYSEETARIIDEEVKRLIDDAYADANRLLMDRWDQVVAVAEALLTYETLQADEVKLLIRGEQLDKPTVAQLLEEEAAKPTDTKPSATATKEDHHGDEPAGDVMPSPA